MEIFFGSKMTLHPGNSWLCSTALAVFVLLIKSSSTLGYYEAPLPYRENALNATDLPCGSQIEVRLGDKYLFDSASAVVYESSQYASQSPYSSRRKRAAHGNQRQQMKSEKNMKEPIRMQIVSGRSQIQARGGGGHSGGHGGGHNRGAASYGHGGGGSYGGGGSGGGYGYPVKPNVCEWSYIADEDCSLEMHIIRFKPGDTNCYKQVFSVSDNHTEFKLCGKRKLYPGFRAETPFLYIKYSKLPYTYRHVFKGYVTCVGRAQRPTYEDSHQYYSPAIAEEENVKEAEAAVEKTQEEFAEIVNAFIEEQGLDTKDDVKAEKPEVDAHQDILEQEQEAKFEAEAEKVSLEDKLKMFNHGLESEVMMEQKEVEQDVAAEVEGGEVEVEEEIEADREQDKTLEDKIKQFDRVVAIHQGEQASNKEQRAEVAEKDMEMAQELLHEVEVLLHEKTVHHQDVVIQEDREREMEREKERERDKEREREAEMERQREKERERENVKEHESERDRSDKSTKENEAEELTFGNSPMHQHQKLVGRSYEDVPVDGQLSTGYVTGAYQNKQRQDFQLNNGNQLNQQYNYGQVPVAFIPGSITPTTYYQQPTGSSVQAIYNQPVVVGTPIASSSAYAIPSSLTYQPTSNPYTVQTVGTYPNQASYVPYTLPTFGASSSYSGPNIAAYQDQAALYTLPTDNYLDSYNQFNYGGQMVDYQQSYNLPQIVPPAGSSSYNFPTFGTQDLSSYNFPNYADSVDPSYNVPTYGATNDYNSYSSSAYDTPDQSYYNLQNVGVTSQQGSYYPTVDSNLNSYYNAQLPTRGISPDPSYSAYSPQSGQSSSGTADPVYSFISSNFGDPDPNQYSSSYNVQQQPSYYSDPNQYGTSYNVQQQPSYYPDPNQYGSSYNVPSQSSSYSDPSQYGTSYNVPSQPSYSDPNQYGIGYNVSPQPSYYSDPNQYGSSYNVPQQQSYSDPNQYGTNYNVPSQPSYYSDSKQYSTSYNVPSQSSYYSDPNQYGTNYNVPSQQSFYSSDSGVSYPFNLNNYNSAVPQDYSSPLQTPNYSTGSLSYNQYGSAQVPPTPSYSLPSTQGPVLISGYQIAPENPNIPYALQSPTQYQNPNANPPLSPYSPQYSGAGFSFIPSAPVGFQYLMSSAKDPTIHFIVTCQLPYPNPCTPVTISPVNVKLANPSPPQPSPSPSPYTISQSYSPSPYRQ